MQRLRRDDGAVAVLVAVCMVALLAVGAFVLDVGRIYAERRQLQNGADAATLAVVMDCHLPAGCAATAGTKAADKANQNANDGASTVASPSGPAVCGSGGGLPACSPDSGLGAWDCPPLPTGPPAAKYVQVRTQTRAPAGGNLVPPFLAQVLVPSYTGSTVRACARASWGAPSGLRSQLPLVISLCEFNFYSSNGTALASTPFDPALERVLHFHTQDQISRCPSSNSGADEPGGFGWIDTDDSGCETRTAVTDPRLPADPGTDVPSACTSTYLDSLVGSIVDVPVFGTTNGLSGNQIAYNIVGYAAFHLTGFKLSGDPAYTRQSATLSASRRCTGNERCIYGYFTRDLAPVEATIGTQPVMGIVAVQMSG
jgi:hypothetical protein